MAIFVSNPTSAAVPPLSSDALEPLAVAPEEGFTEELAAAMQPSAVPTEAAAITPLDKLDEAGKKAADLQILPAEVLMNAVGDANFAMAGQAGAAQSTAQNSVPGTVWTEATEASEASEASEAIEQAATSPDSGNQLQGAELAAANLAAQMSASAANVAAPEASNSGAGSTVLSVGTTSSSGQALHASASGTGTGPISGPGPILDPNMPEGAQVASPATLASAQNQPSLNTNSQSLGNGSISEASQHIAANAPAQSQAAGGESVATTKLAANLTEAQSTSVSPLALKADAISQKARVSKDVAVAMTSNEPSPKNAPATALTEASLNGASVAKTDSNQAAQIAVSSNTQAEARAQTAQESAFNFDAKLAKSDAQRQQANLTLNGKTTGIQAAATTEIDATATAFSQLQSNIRIDQNVSGASSNRLDAASLSAASPNSTALAQEASRAETTQSLEDISSSFVSSLVGGPQRPVTTVMDWISMQSQERAAPLVPHEVRLDAGAIQLEIQKMVKQGGGHVVMELTPPDQSKFTIELKLDERGNALLIVEGVSDSTKTRLEQSAPQLREQFQQMGLELQLDMRQQGQSASSNAANFADYQERGSSDNHTAGDPSKVLTQREAGALRARETGSNQVYLYA
ncbi:MAG: flagellar hook-length control protein FliK [Burkholderiales bacterium]|nr:flagellar hook-length control protein FliK [Burkholderiales bacterium]